MTKKHWTENEIEDHLNKLPPVKDQQSKDELFELIQKKMNNEQTNNEDQSLVVKRKKRTWLYPMLASAAAVFLILLILPSFLQEQEPEISTMDAPTDSSEDRAEEDELATNEDDPDMEIAIDDGNEAADQVETEGESFSEVEEESLEESEEAAEVNHSIGAAIPKVFDVEVGNTIEERVALIETTVEMNEETGSTLEEVLVYLLSKNEDLELESLQEIEFREEEKTADLHFSEDHQLGSLTGYQYHAVANSLKELFGHYGFEEVKFYVDGEPGIMFGPEGERFEFDVDEVNRGYYVYEDADGVEYLIRNTMVGEPFENEDGELFTFDQTINHMQNVEETAWYRSFIPEFIEVTDIDVADDRVLLAFSGDENISNVEEQKSFDLFLRGVLVTAADFDYETLSLYSESSGHLGDYTLSNPVIPNLPLGSS
ncbi:hypothetical protein [Evansella halocellulosilytica]|uniref:hypothetical protein n=1 Tax=Evansella halocellulosilytica TaxID=2011013 RepID=UPI000BB97982|nr:hypothetical protein [Evansella halocellulosilytica]